MLNYLKVLRESQYSFYGRVNYKYEFPKLNKLYWEQSKVNNRFRGIFYPEKIVISSPHRIFVKLHSMLFSTRGHYHNTVQVEDGFEYFNHQCEPIYSWVDIKEQVKWRCEIVQYEQQVQHLRPWQSSPTQSNIDESEVQRCYRSIRGFVKENEDKLHPRSFSRYLTWMENGTPF